MTSTGSFVVSVLLVVALSTPVLAQAPASPPSPPASARSVDRDGLRHQVYVMEGALVRAVSFGAQRLNREIRSVAPELIALSGDPQARGVYLEGYGVYFDVGVPILHQSMAWSLRTLMGNQDLSGVADALSALRRMARESSGPMRADAERALARIELQIGPMGDVATPEAFQTMRPNAPAVGASILKPEAARPEAEVTAPTRPMLDKKYMDPNALDRAYTESVQSALIDAMIDYGQPMAIKPDEFLTVAARANMQRDSLAPRDPYEQVVTILLRIKGSDLAAYRSQQIDGDEVRRRIQIREF